MVALNENFGRGHFGLGTVFLRVNNSIMALAELTKAINLETNNSLYYFMRGNAYFSKSDFNNAEKDYVSAIRIRSKFPEAFYNLGMAEIKNKKQRAGRNDNLQNSLKLGYKQAQKAIDTY